MAEWQTQWRRGLTENMHLNRAGAEECRAAGKEESFPRGNTAEPTATAVLV